MVGRLPSSAVVHSIASWDQCIVRLFDSHAEAGTYLLIRPDPRTAATAGPGQVAGPAAVVAGGSVAGMRWFARSSSVANTASASLSASDASVVATA